MASPPLVIPEPILDWIRQTFAEVNLRSSVKLSRNANVWETSLDMTVIEQLSQFTVPVKFPSEWVVRLETHYLGGGRYWGRWEIADVGILIVFRKRGKSLATKIALLQSKRLYPNEVESEKEDLPVDYIIGFGRLLESDGEYRSNVKSRTFHFSDQSQYRALEYASDQYQAILKYIQDSGIAVHYLLYNPLTLPWTVTLPATNQLSFSNDNPVGCRVIAARDIDSKLQAAAIAKSANPTYAHLGSDAWRLETFVADLVLRCKEGYLTGTNPLKEEALFRVFNLRSGPISAAISITIDAPAEEG